MPRLYLAHLDADPPDVKLAIPGFKVCAFYEQFGEHSRSDCVETSAVSLTLFPPPPPAPTNALPYSTLRGTCDD
jgi:hypothetical protein